MKLGLVAAKDGADGSKIYATGGAVALMVYPSPDHAGKGISPRAGGGRIAWFKDPDGNTFAVQGNR